jgi:isopentenyl diphosphate isomerase/L-lactate dehydrogenase-like FMN-dependent dehydrogenase
MRFSPEALTHPRWLLKYLRRGQLLDLTVPNLTAEGEAAPAFFGAYGQWQATTPPSWDDVAWLRQQWGGPFMLKGVTRIDDAKRAVDAGVTAISVSNHGGNNLDGTPGTIRLLSDIARAVGDQAEVLLDGGIRRGGDVAKALALGARAVMIGRAYLWAWRPTARPASRTCWTCCAAAWTRACSASATPRSVTSARPTW